MSDRNKPWYKEYEALCEAVNIADGSKAKKNIVKKDIRRVLRKTGKFDFNLFPPQFRWNVCASRMRLGDFSNYDGWTFRSDWSMTFQGYNGYKTRLPKWDGSPVSHLVVMGEQGVGDEIMFASALPELIARLGGNTLEFQCTDRLRDVFSRSFGIRCTHRQDLNEITEGDAIVALADLFMFFRRKKEHFPKKPFIKPDPERVEFWKRELDKLGTKPKIGIAWKARHGDLKPDWLMFEDAIYVNLQYLKHPFGKWREFVPEGVHHIGPDPINDISDHINFVAALDKVVSVTQTVVHEAASVGVETHVIRPRKGTGEVNNALWYYGIGNCDHHVYGNVKIWDKISEYRKWMR